MYGLFRYFITLYSWEDRCIASMMTSTGRNLLQKRCLGCSLLCSSVHISGEAVGDLAVWTEHQAAHNLSWPLPFTAEFGPSRWATLSCLFQDKTKEEPGALGPWREGRNSLIAMVSQRGAFLLSYYHHLHFQHPQEHSYEKSKVIS